VKDFDERRAFARLQITLEVRVSGPGGVSYGKLRDLSKGNASFFLDEPVGKLGDTLDVILPFSEEEDVAVMGELLRFLDTPQGKLHAIRFSMVEPAMKETLNHFIEHSLTLRGSETRKYPRITYHVPITYRGLSSGRAVLETIAMGGLGFTTKEPIDLNLDLTVEIPWPKQERRPRPPLSVTGCAVSQYSMEKDGVTTWRVGIQFKRTTTEMQKSLDAYIREILDLTI